MANSYLTSTDIIASIKRRGSIPESQNTFTSQDFLDLANEEMAMGVVPHILQFHEEYLVHSEDVSLVDGQVNYSVPYRAVGNKLRDVCYVDTSGNEYEMTRVNPDDAFETVDNLASSFIATKRFKMESGNVVLLTKNPTGLTGSLRFRYFLRPNLLILSNRAAQISSINTTTGVITFSGLCPSHFTTSISYDFNRTKSDHRIISFDVSATAVGSSSITVSPVNIPSTLEVGDYVCSAGETFIPNIPTELHVMLSHRVYARCMEALGDAQGLQNANAKLQEMEAKTGSLIDSRVDGASLKVLNRHSLLRSARYRRSVRG